MDFNIAIELKPNYGDAYENRGLAKEDLKDYLGAILDCNKAIELKSDYPSTYFCRGTAKLSIKVKDYQGGKVIKYLTFLLKILGG